MFHLAALLIIIALLPRALAIALPVAKGIMSYALKAVGIAIGLFLLVWAYVEFVDKPGEERKASARAAFDAKYMCDPYHGYYYCPDQRAATKAEKEEYQLIRDNSYEAYLKMTPAQRLARLQYLAGN